MITVLLLLLLFVLFVGEHENVKRLSLFCQIKTNANCVQEMCFRTFCTFTFYCFWVAFQQPQVFDIVHFWAKRHPE
jgi:hypothetical protein